MTRLTSIEAYNKIKADGLLSKRRFEVYSTLFKYGPMTANETFSKMYDKNTGPTNAASNSAARFSELRQQGVIYEVKERKCKITGMNVIEWGVTNNLPVKIKKEKKITDTARLEFMILKAGRVMQGVAGLWFCSHDDNKEQTAQWFKSPREAIYAAMKEGE